MWRDGWKSFGLWRVIGWGLDVANYLLDTTVLIDYLRGAPGTVTVVKDLARAGHVLGCCCVNVTEVYSGLRGKEYAAAKRLLESLRYFDVPFAIARRAGEFRNQYALEGITLSTSDTIVAAVAEAEDAVLLTGNVRHYPMVDVVQVQTA